MIVASQNGCCRTRADYDNLVGLEVTQEQKPYLARWCGSWTTSLSSKRSTDKHSSLIANCYLFLTIYNRWTLTLACFVVIPAHFGSSRSLYSEHSHDNSTSDRRRRRQRGRRASRGTNQLLFSSVQSICYVRRRRQCTWCKKWKRLLSCVWKRETLMCKHICAKRFQIFLVCGQCKQLLRVSDYDGTSYQAH